MVQGFSCCNSVKWVFLQQFFEEVQGVIVKFLILAAFEGDVAGSVLAENFIVTFSGEGAHSEEENMEDESQAEHVANGVVFGLHVLDVDDLGSYVAGSAASDEEVLFSIRKLSQTEVGDDAFSPTFFRSEDQVLRFEISVHGFFGVHFFESLQYGVDNQFRLMRFEFVFGFDFIVELSSF